MEAYSLDQPEPVNKSADFNSCWHEVLEKARNVDLPESIIDLMVERNEVGIKRYGVPLMPFNGRNARADALMEALDLLAYLQQIIMENSVEKSWDPTIDKLFNTILLSLPHLHKNL